MKQTLFIAAFLVVCVSVLAQPIIKGRVLEESTNKPLPGATILYGGNKLATATDGTFTIECGKANRLTVSYVGYSNKEVSVKNCNEELSISLSPSVNNLENVEITATSSQNKSLLYQPSSITKLSPVELKR